MIYLGIEIGGTKLQLGVGPGDGQMLGLWRTTVDPAAGGEGIRQQIVAGVPELLGSAGLDRGCLAGVGIGFGGPVDDHRRCVIKSHQISGWNRFPLVDWIGETLGLPAVLGNDADVAGLAEALFGAGKGMSPILYITIGSGIGGGLIVGGEILRGTGLGAAEIGHLRLRDPGRGVLATDILENIASGWAIGRRARERAEQNPGDATRLIELAGSIENITAQTVAIAAEAGDRMASSILGHAMNALAEAICAAIVLVCPQRVVIGGGVSLMGETLFFDPLRYQVAERVFAPFAGQTDIVSAELGEAVVVHGALALARQKLGG